MKTGINWEPTRTDHETGEQIRLMKENGLEASFVGSNDPEVDRVVAAMKQAGIVCESFHAPFAGINRMWTDGEGGEAMLAELTAGVYACARNDVPVLVVHLSSGDLAPTVNDLGLERFSRLMAEAKCAGVTIAYENQRKLGNLAVIMELFPEAKFCWDVGHEECFAYGREYMPLFGDRIAALHLHDNFREHNGDLHLLPYDGKIDLKRKAELLAKSDYHGSVMLEISRFGRYASLSSEEYYARASRAAKRFAEEVKKFREACSRKQ